MNAIYAMIIILTLGGVALTHQYSMEEVCNEGIIWPVQTSGSASVVSVVQSPVGIEVHDALPAS